MVAAPYSFDLFSRADKPARTKVILLGSADRFPSEVLNRICSLHIEHVSPAHLMRRGISRPRRGGATAESADLAAVRHWFWTRKPDAGFLLSEFPATLLQAQVFDEWLEARNETLDLAISTAETSVDLIEHYRELGLLSEPTPASAYLQ